MVKSDARKRLDLVLAAQEAVLTIPLEPFAMQRLQDRLRDLVSGYGMVVRIGFTAEEAPSGRGWRRSISHSRRRHVPAPSRARHRRANAP